jgi:hypothetical protein
MRSVLLVLLSNIFSLLLAELGLRLFQRVKGSASESSTVEATPFDAGDGMRHVSQRPAVPRTGRWLLEDRPRLPNRWHVRLQRLARHKGFERRGSFGPPADYRERFYVESQRCAPNGFQNYAGSILALA